MVSDAAWAWMEPLLRPRRAVGVAGGGSSAGPRGDLLEVPTGSPWRELPERWGPWQTAYERLTRWSADGTWAKLLARAQADADAAGELDWLVAVDSTVVRVHQHGASARRVGGNAATVLPDDPEDGAAVSQRAGGRVE